MLTSSRNDWNRSVGSPLTNSYGDPTEVAHFFDRGDSASPPGGAPAPPDDVPASPPGIRAPSADVVGQCPPAGLGRDPAARLCLPSDDDSSVELVTDDGDADAAGAGKAAAPPAAAGRSARRPAKAASGAKTARTPGGRNTRARRPTKHSAFVMLFATLGGEPKLYMLRNRYGKLGVPGGKGEPQDRTHWLTASREFREETGAEMPRGSYSHFAWGDGRHTITCYYRTLTAEEAQRLPVGDSPDPEGSEVEILWGDYSTEQRGRFRPHIAIALGVHDHVRPAPDI